MVSFDHRNLKRIDSIDIFVNYGWFRLRDHRFVKSVSNQDQSSAEKSIVVVPVVFRKVALPSDPELTAALIVAV